MNINETLVSRRQFIKYSALGLAAITVGPRLPWALSPQTEVRAQASGINLGMTTADVEMVDGNQVPHWVYTVDGRPTLPGPLIFAYEQEEVQINITNNIPGPARRLAIVGNDFAGNAFALVQQSGDIAFGATGSLTIAAGSLAPGTYLYKDPTLDPISRVLGLHGALVILPNPAVSQTNPYGNAATPNVRDLFAALGEGTPRDPAAFFPGQPWFATTDANPAGYQPHHNDSDHHHYMHFIAHPNGPQSPVLERFLYRTRIWLHSAIDPRLNRQVITEGNLPDPATVQANFVPHYFSINGRQGAFAMHSADLFPCGTIGEPYVIRLLNAGLITSSPHQHGNHAYIVAVNNVVGGGGIYFGNEAGTDNVIFLDTVTLAPEDRVDWVLPFIRPPDIPRVVGSDGLLLPLAQLAAQELDLVLVEAQNPLWYPMHSHMELDQTAAGGNYPQGAVTGWDITGEFGSNFKPQPMPIAPIAGNDSAATNGTTPVTVSVLTNDTINGQPIAPQNATLTLVTPPSNGAVVLNGDKTFTYTANAGFVGADSFTYTVTVDGQVSNAATVSVTVAAIALGRLDLQRFRVTKSVRLSRAPVVVLDVWARNRGKTDSSATITVVGMQNGNQIYTHTLTTNVPKGKSMKVTFPPFTPSATGTITWTATLQGATATAKTEVRK